MRVLILNQYGPPDPSPTALLAGELKRALEESGHEVEIVAPVTDYRRAPKGGLMRWLREFSCLFKIWIDGLRTDKPDYVISFTSPPCLVVVAEKVAGWHRAQHIHWVLDLYPDLAMQLKALSEDHPFGRLLVQYTKSAFRKCEQVVVLDEDMQHYLMESYNQPCTIIPPWPPQSITDQEGDADRYVPQIQGPLEWVYSGNLGQAHPWKVLLRVQKELELQALGEFRLVMQGGGTGRGQAQDYAKELGLKEVEWRPYADLDKVVASLSQAHVLVVTQEECTRGLLLPSKLMVCLGLKRPILWVGPAHGSSAWTLKQASSEHGVFSHHDPDGIASWLLQMKDSPSRTNGLRPMASLSERRLLALGAWKRLL